MDPKIKLDTKLESTARAYLVNAKLTSKQIKKLEEMGYFTAPAAMRHHLNRPQGLIEHSINVTNKILGLKVFENRASAFRVGMLHDVVKCLCYYGHEKKDGTGWTYSYTQPPYPGHGVASALILADLGIDLTPEERAAVVWHMGVYKLDEDQLEEYRAAKTRFPRAVLLTHVADDLSSVYETIQQNRGKKADKGEEEKEDK